MTKIQKNVYKKLNKITFIKCNDQRLKITQRANTISTFLQLNDGALTGRNTMVSKPPAKNMPLEIVANPMLLPGEYKRAILPHAKWFSYKALY